VEAAYKDERGYFIGRAPLPRVPAVGFKVCHRCKDEKPVDAFSPDKRSPDGLLYWCRACRAEDFRVRRKAKKDAMSPEDNAARVWRMNPEMLAVKTKALLAAARDARTQGCWRGRSAIRAYRNLGIAIEALHVPTPERRDAMDRDVAPCSCPAWPCSRHKAEVQP
jgi:ribosomal protein L40E